MLCWGYLSPTLPPKTSALPRCRGDACLARCNVTCQPNARMSEFMLLCCVHLSICKSLFRKVRMCRSRFINWTVIISLSNRFSPALCQCVCVHLCAFVCLCISAWVCKTTNLSCSCAAATVVAIVLAVAFVFAVITIVPLHFFVAIECNRKAEREQHWQYSYAQFYYTCILVCFSVSTIVLGFEPIMNRGTTSMFLRLCWYAITYYCVEAIPQSVKEVVITRLTCECSDNLQTKVVSISSLIWLMSQWLKESMSRGLGTINIDWTFWLVPDLVVDLRH